MNDIGVIHFKNGGFAIVDREDFEWVNSKKWWRGVFGHPCTTVNNKTINMGRFILNPPKELIAEHKNRFPIDNTRRNLRCATISQNGQNKAKLTDRKTSSQYKGVTKCSDRNAWKVQLRTPNKRLWIGRFKNERDAAIAYNKAAEIHHGEFAVLNNIPEVQENER